MTETAAPSAPEALPRTTPTEGRPGLRGGDVEAIVPDARRARLRSILFRLHFFGGFFAAPIALWLAITGILFAWNPQIESWIFGDERAAVEGAGELQPLSDQIDAVLAQHPDHDLVEVTPADEAGETTAVLLKPSGAQAEGFGHAPGAFTAYVDPVSTEVTGSIDESRRPDEWIRNLHSNFRLGTRAGTLTELAASWVLVSLATGLYLWWPRTRNAVRRAVVPRLKGLRGGGRRPWRDLHSSLGFLVLGAISVMVVTGLTWTEYAGHWIDVGKGAVTADAPSLQTGLPSTGEHHGGGGGSEVAVDVAAFDDVAATAADAGLTAPYIITPASAPGEAWTVAEDDSTWPIEGTQVAVDPDRREVVDRLEFTDDPLLEQATSVGIWFHQAELFGLVNQLVLTVLALALVALLVTGYVMWWKRRPAGAFGPPPRLGSVWQDVPVPFLAGFVLLLVFLPVMGMSFLLYLVIERVVWLARRRRSAPPPAPPASTSPPGSSSTPSPSVPSA
jgi:uncharacterized iron-regulated membrane protein